MLQETDTSLVHPKSLIQIESFRNQAANKVFFAIAIIAPFVLATGIYRAATLGWKPLMYWQSGFGLLIMGTALLYKRIGYRLRVLTMICIFFFLGIGGLLTWGLMGMGVYFFIFGNLFANLCFGSRIGFPLTLTSLVCMTVIALAGHYQWIGIKLDFNQYAWAPSSWSTMIITTGAFLGILHFGLHQFFSYLTDMIQSLEHRSRQLMDANRRLKREMSERGKIEKALRDSETKYRMVVDNANEGIVVLKDERIHFANDMILKEIDYSFEELSRKKANDFLHPADQESSDRAIEMILDGKIDFDDREMRLLDGKGEYRWFNVHSVRTLWENQPAIISFLYEITDRKTVEAEKAHLQNRLIQAEKMEILGTLAGTVAHDLNNVLMGVTSYPEYLLTKIPENSELRKPMETIKKSGNKAAAMVQDMLTLARRRIKVSKVCNLNHLVNQFLNSLEFKKLHSYNSKVTVETDLNDQLENIKGSPLHLSKTIMNLVSNALDSVTDGGCICIATENRTAAPHSGHKKDMNPKTGPYAVLKITDNGSGIAPDEIERIFDPFFTKKTMGKSGTGLGMVVVWNAVQDHGGYIHVDSVEGLGTTFTLFFPATTAEQESIKPDRPVETVRGNGETVLYTKELLF